MSELLGRARLLAGSLWWRTRQEGLRNLLAAFLPFAAVIGLTGGLSLANTHAINGRAAFAAFAVRYGASTDAVSIGIALLMWPGLVAMFASLAVAGMVRNIVGAETTRGSVEALLALPFTPRTIAAGLVLYAGALATLFWVGMVGVAGAALAILLHATGARLALSGTYTAMALALPLLAAWASAALALLVNLLYPRLAQMGGYGLQMGGQGIGGLPAMLPALGVLFMFLFGTAHRHPAAALALAGVAVAAITAIGLVAIARGFRPESVLAT